jgi:hypothetical protein
VLESTSFLLLWPALRELGPWLRSEKRDFCNGGGGVGGVAVLATASWRSLTVDLGEERKCAIES